MFVTNKKVYHVSPYDNLVYPRFGGGDYGKGFYTSHNEEGALYYAQSRTDKGLPDLISINGQWINSNLLEDYFLYSQGILDENTSTRDKKNTAFIQALLYTLKRKGGEATFSRAELEEMLATHLNWSTRWQNDTQLREAFFKKFANVPLKTKRAEKANTSLYEVNISGNFLQFFTLDRKHLTLIDNGYNDLDTKTLYGIMKLDYPKKNPIQVIENADRIAYLLMLEYHFSKDKLLNPISDKELQTVKKERALLENALEKQFLLLSDPEKNNTELQYRTFDKELKQTLQLAENLMKYSLLHLPTYSIYTNKSYNIDILNFDGTIDLGTTKNTYYYIIRNLKTATLTRIKNEKTDWKWQKVKKAPPPLDKRIIDVLTGPHR